MKWLLYVSIHAWALNSKHYKHFFYLLEITKRSFVLVLLEFHTFFIVLFIYAPYNVMFELPLFYTHHTFDLSQKAPNII